MSYRLFYLTKPISPLILICGFMAWGPSRMPADYSPYDTLMAWLAAMVDLPNDHPARVAPHDAILFCRKRHCAF